MLDRVASALNRQDYQTAAKLIAALVAERPDDPQVQLYAAQLQEATNKLARALEMYRLLLQQTVNLKITTDARRGIARIEEQQAQDRANELAVARNGIIDNIEPGLLVLEPISIAQKQSVVDKFAEIMAIDSYRTHLRSF